MSVAPTVGLKPKGVSMSVFWLITSVFLIEGIIKIKHPKDWDEFWTTTNYKEYGNLSDGEKFLVLWATWVFEFFLFWILSMTLTNFIQAVV